MRKFDEEPRPYISMYDYVFCSWAEVFRNTFSYLLSRELAFNPVAVQ
jgi:hypothetical protein